MHKALIFDCDGVLVDSEVLLIDIEIETMAEYGLHYTPERFKELYLGTSIDAFYETAHREHNRVHGTPLPECYSSKVHDRVSTAFDKHLEPVVGIADLLSNIDHLDLAVASNSQQKWLDRKMAHTSLNDFFGTHIYSSEIVENGKPAPDIYLYAANQIQADPTKCIVVEDSINGVKAAKAANMTCISFSGGGHCDDIHVEKLKNSIADHHAHDADELFRLIKELS